ncbi:MULTISPECIES: CDP-diacylglycerol--serine O-phosphatidyltransferase [Aneurinibacillus]|uniref:CDP-diacylglycerol--serine O-phosphatidyltransferase n=1 Tax=Aneurinibacillus thermoaerophilus TaxID=143495 RepID=A0A1G8CVQ3_ANETH|nr:MULTISPECIES: CDP-diacylglycerol--serine O-phosphatidyltransferase [Aneurinibacillus]AMA74480.1 CDP-diacylglycerol--serine O-phosphatidyltransferase [Aneurinibacillus sp. XH2]MED0677303.1 CDP-diacylglycerol--serine O-phosphatidyltransferase [Aneurinibacillus thermoaerophilus]MED0679067.1 CDP-diacylglycerol--serine O-phosphatidyltransferase [Aneurinibacillus thermoaerophilus]MED0738736.1 CDP-diacylglycerol--serine O-phosphatidyltransferase [Aneurinibacillus thermoaerophilus]MED0757837.1 CDP-
MIARTIPNLFTVGNLFLGIIAMLLAFRGEPTDLSYAAIMVIIGMVFDGLDGRLARMLNAQSDFGKELDSLSDIVTFGVAPALIMYVVVLGDMGWTGILLTGLFPICGALRLARFNSSTSGNTGYFVGLPITAAGGVLATLALYHNAFPPIYLVLSMLGLSYLMISNIKYPNFKKVGIPRSAYWVTPLVVLIAAIMAVRFPAQFPMVVFIPLVFYALYGVKKNVKRMRRKRRRENTEEEIINL